MTDGFPTAEQRAWLENELAEMARERLLEACGVRDGQTEYRLTGKGRRDLGSYIERRKSALRQ
jgi:hypothetical protein